MVSIQLWRFSVVHILYALLSSDLSLFYVKHKYGILGGGVERIVKGETPCIGLRES